MRGGLRVAPQGPAGVGGQAEPDPGPRPGQLALILAAVTSGVLASAAAVPAAFAATNPGGHGGTIITPALAPARVVAAGGMAGCRSP